MVSPVDVIYTPIRSYIKTNNDHLVTPQFSARKLWVFTHSHRCYHILWMLLLLSGHLMAHDKALTYPANSSDPNPIKYPLDGM